jgi:outer membrane protein OmpA-like peptidoglycan-associated protein
MKKIISFLFALAVMVSMANAQTTVVNKGVFSQIYVGISGGANYTPVSGIQNFDKANLHYNGALEIGKSITPITSLSLQGIYNPKTPTAQTVLNGSEKLDRMDLFANVKFNLMNLFGGYNGNPRVFEINTLTGVGWNHYFGSYRNPNDIALQAGLEFDFNLGKNRNWYISLTPAVQFNELNDGYTGVAPAFKHGDLKTNVGVTYRIGQGKSHNFAVCDKKYTEEQYNELYTEYENVINNAKADTVLVEKIIEVEKPVEIGYVTECITFDKNSDVIKGTEMQRLDLYMHNMSKDITYVVCGSADTNTGNYDYNNKLAQKRADAVVKVLKENGFNAETAVKLDALDVTELSRCAIITKK